MQASLTLSHFKVDYSLFPIKELSLIEIKLTFVKRALYTTGGNLPSVLRIFLASSGVVAVRKGEKIAIRILESLLWIKTPTRMSKNETCVIKC